MKTSVNLVRKLDTFDVIQRTKDSMFNATLLCSQWNAATGDKKEVTKFLENQNTKTFIQALIKEENLHTQKLSYVKDDMSQDFSNTQNSPHLETRANQGVSNTQNLAYLKTRANQGIPEYAFTTTRGNNGGTWMHPLLFIKFAMWLNPTFEVKVLKFVYDELVKDRHLAGDNYRLLSASISQFPDVNYPQVAKALNWIVFNRHTPEIRNTATPAQMQELHDTEQKLAYAVDMGLINSYPELIAIMRKMYNKKYEKF